MDVHYLHDFFHPRTIVIFTSDDFYQSIGKTLISNLQKGGYRGELFLIHPDGIASENSLPTFQSLEKLKEAGWPAKGIDLALIAVPPYKVIDVLRTCGQSGIRSVILHTGGTGFSRRNRSGFESEVLQVAREVGVRFVGPNCPGILRPAAKLNATFGLSDVLPGGIALVSQSGAVSTAILDRAGTDHVGFSAVLSPGDAVDTDFGDILTYLATDIHTRSILLYVEGIRHARNFLSGLRIAARMKPVVIVKGGRHEESSRAAMFHTGAMVGSDAVFNAALERSGAVRARTMEQLLFAAEILSSDARVKGNRLCIITNGGGPGVLATDRAEDLGVRIADLSYDTLRTPGPAFPDPWSPSNPVDLHFDAGPERYEEAVRLCLEDPGIDGLLVLYAPRPGTDPLHTARSVVRGKQTASTIPVITSWMGEGRVVASREYFASEKIPSFPYPEAAVEAFAYMARYWRNQKLLAQLPGAGPREEPSDPEGAGMIAENALEEGRHVLDIPESRAMLAAFRIPVKPVMIARNAGEALVAAETLRFPVAMKVDAPDIADRQQAGGVRLNISSPHEVRLRYDDIMRDVKSYSPGVEIRGVTVEPMMRSNKEKELFIGVSQDPVFGPVIQFGLSGYGRDVAQERAVAIPPLNRFIIEQLIARTKADVLREEGFPMEQMVSVLLRVSEMVCELPIITEMILDPVVPGDQGIVVADARILVEAQDRTLGRYGHMAIHPYPADLVEFLQLKDGRPLIIRPIQPDDADREQDFVKRLSPQTRYFRFMQAVQELTPEMLVRFTQIDYDREMALVAMIEDDEGQEIQIGVSRYVTAPDGENCDFAVVISDEWKGFGIGTILMESLMKAARSRGLKRIRGDVLPDNSRMLKLMKKLSFHVSVSKEDPSLYLVEREL